MFENLSLCVFCFQKNEKKNIERKHDFQVVFRFYLGSEDK